MSTMGLGRARKVLVKARAELASEHWEAAAAAAREALAAAPGAREALVQCALALLDAGHAEEAVPLLEEAVRKAPRNAAYPVFLGLAHLDAGHGAEARAALDHALEMQPENLLASGLLAVLALRERTPRAALDTVRRDGVEASRRLVGRLLVEVEETIRRLDPAREGLASTSSEASASDATQPGCEAPPSDATQPSNEVPPSDAAPAPQAPPPGNLLMRLYQGFGRMVDSSIAQVLLWRAERALLRSRLEEATQWARRAVERSHEAPRALSTLAMCLLQGHQAEQALGVVEEAQRVDGKTPDVLYLKGCCLQEMGRLAEAREALQEMLAGFAKDAPAMHALGLIELQEGNLLLARRYFEQAANLDFLVVRERLDHLRQVVENAPPDSPVVEAEALGTPG